MDDSRIKSIINRFENEVAEGDSILQRINNIKVKLIGADTDLNKELNEVKQTDLPILDDLDKKVSELNSINSKAREVLGIIEDLL